MKNKKNSYVGLSCGGMASKKFHEQVQHVANQAIPSMDSSACYKTKEIYGKKAWGKMSIDERCAAENCMVDIAIHITVMLEFVGETPKGFALFSKRDPDTLDL